MNAPIPGNANVTALVRNLGADLVHAEYGHVEVWDVRKCTSLIGAFSASTIQGSLDLSFWDTRKVTTAYAAFSGASVDANVSTWDVSQVEDMGAMFLRAKGFNGDVSEWDVGRVRKMAEMFSGASRFNGDVSRWDVGRVNDMDMMFVNATSFNRDLSDWNVRSVSSMRRMFNGATLFNSDLRRWDVSSVVKMANMFNGATSFAGPTPAFPQHPQRYKCPLISHVALSFRDNLGSKKHQGPASGLLSHLPP